MSYRHYGSYNNKTHVILGYNEKNNMFLIMDPQSLNDRDNDLLGKILEGDFAASRFNLSEVLGRESHPGGGDWFTFCINRSLQVPSRHISLFDREQSQHWLGDPTNYTDPENNRTPIEKPFVKPQPPAEFLQETSPETVITVQGDVEIGTQLEQTEPNMGSHTGGITPPSPENYDGVEPDEFHELQGQVKVMSKTIKDLVGSVRSLTRELKKVEKVDADVSKK